MNISELERAIAEGEGASVEFKAELPDTESLAKELAAFGTSGGGVLWIGVSDDGAVCGLHACSTPGQRDAAATKVANVAGASVQPAIRPRIGWVEHPAGVVLCVKVARLGEPIYYAKGKPYIRSHASSRPATPDEVKERFIAWYTGVAEERARKDVGEMENASRMASRVAVLADQWSDGFVEPFASSLRNTLSMYSADIRIAASAKWAERLDVVPTLLTVSTAIDGFVSIPLAAGAERSARLASAAKRVDTHARATVDALAETLPMSRDATVLALEEIDDWTRKAFARASSVPTHADFAQWRTDVIHFAREAQAALLLHRRLLPEKLLAQLWEPTRALHACEPIAAFLGRDAQLRRIEDHALRLNSARAELTDYLDSFTGSDINEQ